ncbi:hypothetical protein WG66_013316 [Moniliophthora roreri]|nr:hypothetical protein WG66_013316 [Moniliophthora roreri]
MTMIVIRWPTPTLLDTTLIFLQLDKAGKSRTLRTATADVEFLYTSWTALRMPIPKYLATKHPH